MAFPSGCVKGAPIDRKDLSSASGAFASFGQLLRHLRLQAHLTQRELAIAVGYSESYLSRLESAARPPDPAMVRARFLAPLALAPDSAWALRLLDLAAAAQAAASASAEPRRPPPPRALLPQEVPARPSAPSRASLRLAPLLATKLHRPQPASGTLVRPRLLALLDSALQLPLTLIAAPAGAGKTTLLAHWLARVERRTQPGEGSSHENLAVRATWLALDRSDSDPPTFLRYLIAALRACAPGVGATTLMLLDLPTSVPVAELLTPLVNDLSALDGTLVVVLDDYHQLDHPEIHAAVGWLLDHRPPGLSLLITSREDPPLPLARMRAQRRLRELRAHDLHLTADECRAMLATSLGVTLTADAAALLTARTEGWAAGIQLAGLALQAHADQGELLAALAQSQRYVADYLVEEVLARLPAHLKRFVVQTALLDRLCGALCDAVLGIRDQGSGDGEPSYSQLLLAELARRQLFLVPLDHTQGWFRYHQLFAEVVRAQLQQGTSRAERALLHGRASAWYEANALIPEAVNHALAADDQPGAVAILARQSNLWLLKGRQQAVLSWLTGLPSAFAERQPCVVLLRAVVAAMLGNHHEAARQLQALDALGGSASVVGQDWLRTPTVAYDLVRATLLLASGDVDQGVLLSERALAAVTDDTILLRGWSLVQITVAYWEASKLEAAEQPLGQLAAASRGAPGIMMSAVLFQGLIALARGQLRRAERAFAELPEQVRPDDGVPNAGLTAIHGHWGMIWYEWDALALAEQQVQTCLTMARALPHATMLSVGYPVLARIRLARGDQVGAEQAIAALEQLLANLGAARPWFQHEQYLRYKLATGDEEAVAALLAAQERAIRPVGRQGYSQQLIRAQLLRTRDPAAAHSLLTQLISAAAADQRVGTLIEALALRAVLAQSQNDRPAAQADLKRALALAEPEGFVRTFVDLGAPMGRLLAAVVEDWDAAPGPSPLRPYAARLLERLAPTAQVAGAPAADAAPTDAPALHARELAVLRLLADGHSNQAIANRLGLSLGAVKHAIHRILGQLGVRSRTAAIARARALGLL